MSSPKWTEAERREEDEDEKRMGSIMLLLPPINGRGWQSEGGEGEADDDILSAATEETVEKGD